MSDFNLFKLRLAVQYKGPKGAQIYREFFLDKV